MFGRKLNPQQEKQIREDVVKALEKKRKADIIKAIQREETANAQPTQAILRNMQEASRQEFDFSEEQKMLRSLFGGGSKIWNLEDSTTGVYLNRTLFSGETETGNLFGMGARFQTKDNSTRRLFF